MQDILFTAIEVLSVGYVALALAAFVSRIDTRKSVPIEPPAPEPTPAPVRAVAKALPAPVTLVVKPQDDLSSKSVAELQALARARKISTRAIGVDRRLNKKELLAALRG